MDGGPCQPGDKPTQLPPARFQNGEVAADHRHIPFIEVAEWPGRRLAGDTSGDAPPDIAALLHGDLRHAGQGLAVLIERRRIADDEDLRPSRHAEVRAAHGPDRPGRSRPVSHCPAGDGVTPAVQKTVRLAMRSPPTTTPSASTRLDAGVGTDLDAHLGEPRVRFARQGLGEGRHDPGSALDQDDAG